MKEKEKIYIGTVTKQCRLMRTFLIKANTEREAAEKFASLNHEQIKAGDEPIQKVGEILSVTPLEWELDIVEI